MTQPDPSMLLTWAPTVWSQVLQGRGHTDTAQQARNQLLIRYHEAVYHYLLRKLRDPQAAQELYSTFALKLIETDQLLRRANPERGSFRNYLKTSLHHMVVDHYRKINRERKVKPLSLDPAEHDIPDEGNDPDFSSIWRQEMLNQTWKALEDNDKKTGQVFYIVLRFQSDNPDLRAIQIAEQLGPKLGKTLTAESVRQTIHRGREKFAQLLMEEVDRSLNNPTFDELERELADLQLLTYCQKALEKRRENKD